LKHFISFFAAAKIFFALPPGRMAVRIMATAVPAPGMAGASDCCSPRTSAQSEEFELVAVLAEGKLTLYLDRYADNAPVPDAEVEVESGAFKAVAAQVAPGVYTVPGQAFAQPGKHPLTISVQAGDGRRPAHRHARPRPAGSRCRACPRLGRMDGVGRLGRAAAGRRRPRRRAPPQDEPQHY
jgi:hypothetical protein